MSHIICKIIIILLCMFSAKSIAQLRVGYYQLSCGLAELLVRQEVLAAFLKDNGLVASFIRMHFHDCFVRGCDGSVLLDPTSPTNQTEKQALPNSPSLRGFEEIDNIKARLEAICKGVVSCVDIIAFAVRDNEGIAYDVPAGRKDGIVSIASEATSNLPFFGMDVNQLTQAFANKGLTQEEVVTLSGAHTLGRSHCASFHKRIYNFSATSNIDPTLDPTYAAQLQQHYPPDDDDTNIVVPMDPLSPTVLDSSGYYNAILANRGLFTSDQTLTSSPETKTQVVQNARNQFLWAENFAAAMVKMGKIDVLTGLDGEIRSNCRVVNT